MYVCMYVWMDGWMDGWIDGWNGSSIEVKEWYWYMSTIQTVGVYVHAKSRIGIGKCLQYISR